MSPAVLSPREGAEERSTTKPDTQERVREVRLENFLPDGMQPLLRVEM